MFVFKLFTAIITAQIVWTLPTTEDKLLTSDLMEYFEDISVDVRDEIIASGLQKREATEVSPEEKRFASLFATTNSTRANHYWTRKRGRDQTTTTEPTYDYYYMSMYTTRFPMHYGYDSDNSREKREAKIKFPRLNIVSSREKREVEPETDAGEAGKQEENPSEDSANLVRKKTQGEPKEKRFENKFGKLNKCCVDESDFPGFNQTLPAAKSQCLMETRKSRKTVDASEDTIEGDGGLFNMFSCERVNRWKTAVTCTMDCVAHKIGMFDAKGVINAEVAKRVISENFAKQQWEQSVSDDLVEKCAKEVKDSTSSPIDSFGFQCSSKAAEFAYCMWRELFLTCPADKQQTSKQCEKLRNVLMKHDENKFSN